MSNSVNTFFNIYGITGWSRSILSAKYILLYFFLLIQAQFIHAQVVVTPAAATNFCVDGNYIGIGDIIVTETNEGDFADGLSQTYIISPPVNFEFRPFVGTAIISASDVELANISMTVSALNATITYDYIADDDPAAFTIIGLQLKAVTAANTGNVTRTGGTAVQFGNNVGNAQNHITLTSSVLTAEAGNSHVICEGEFYTLGGAPTASGGTGFYTYSWMPGGSTNSNPTVAPIVPSTTYTVTVTDFNGCSDTDNVTVIVAPLPPVADAGSNISLCNTNTILLAANDPGGHLGEWTVVLGDGSHTFSDINDENATFTGTYDYFYILRWTIYGVSCAPTEDDMSIQFSSLPSPAVAGVNQTLCGVNSTLLDATPVINGFDSWVIVSGVGGSFSNSNDPKSFFNGTIGETYELSWSVSNGSCATNTDNVIIKFDEYPTVSNAGADQAICGNVATLTANNAVIGTGEWSEISGHGDGSFSDVSIENTTFTGVLGTSYDLRWTITNGSCPASTSDVNIQFDVNPTVANAGSNQTMCTNSATLAANIPAVGIGIWSEISGHGNGSFGDVNVSNTIFTGVAGFTYTLEWKISNGACAASASNVTIQFDADPTLADAGLDQDLCAVNSTLLTANMAIVGTGTWTEVSGDGNGNFGNINVENTTFTGTFNTAYVLRWTINNGTCISSFSDVNITLSQNPTAASAGLTQTVCGNSVVLTANNPAIGVGTWSEEVGDGNGVFTNINIGNTTFTGTTGVSYTLRWTISNGSCLTSESDVIITLDKTPTPSNAGTAQTVCGDNTILEGNEAVVGTGEWSVIAGIGGTFDDISIENTIFYGTIGTSYTLRWTISNGVCPASTSDVTIQFDENPTAANAGLNQNICGITSATLAGNAPLVGTGQWVIAGGTGGTFIGSSTIPNAQFTGNYGVLYILRWSISNASCPTSSDLVFIRFYDNPSAANAGTNQQVCGGSTVMEGVAPTVGNGNWSIFDNPDGMGSIGTSSNPTSAFTGTPGETYTLRWTVSNGACMSNSDDVIIKFDELPTTSNAGLDQEICGTSATLAANTPVIGTGQWTEDNGDGNGVFGDVNIENTIFTGTAGTTYVLKWTITNGVCSPSENFVVINFKRNPSTAFAGNDKSECGNATTLGASAPTIGVGQWSFASGGNVDALGNIVDINDRQSDFTGTPGKTYTLSWTVTNGTCPGNSDDVDIMLEESPIVLATPNTQTICSGENTSIALSEMVGVPGLITYNWTAVYAGASGALSGQELSTDVGGAQITENVLASGNTAGTATFTIFAVNSATCISGVASVVTVTVNPLPDVLLADEQICDGGTTNIIISNPNAVLGTTFSWTIQSVNNVSGATAGTGSLIAQLLTNTDGASPGTIVYEVTPSAAGCDGMSNTVTVTVNPIPVINNLTVTICSDDVLNYSPISTVVGTTYTWLLTNMVGSIDPLSVTNFGTGAIMDAPKNIGNSFASVSYEITPEFAGCVGIKKQFSVIINPIPDATVNDFAPTVCSGNLSNIVISSPKNLSGTTYSWIVSSITPGIGGATNGAGNVITDMLNNPNNVAGFVTYTITPTATASGVECEGSSIDVVVTVEPAAIVTAGFNTTVCVNEGLSLNGTIGGLATSATWSTDDGLGTFVNNNALNTLFTPHPTHAGTDVVIILTTNDPAGPCGAESSSFTLSVNPLPNVSFAGLAAEYPVNAPEVNLFGLPIGGTFNGPGINVNKFTPALAGVGTHQINYNYTDANLCTNTTANQQVIVRALPVVSILSPLEGQIFCIDDSDFVLKGNPDATNNTLVTGIFSGIGVVGNSVFRPQQAGAGTHTITYTYTDEFLSTNTVQIQVMVKELPLADFSFINACAGDDVHFTDASTVSETGDSIIGWTWDFGDASSVSNNQNTTHSYTGGGQRNVKLTVESSFGCTDSKIRSVDVGEFPDAKFDVKKICLGDATEFTNITAITPALIDSIQWKFTPLDSVMITNGSNSIAHVFQDAKEYDVVLTVFTKLGCNPQDTTEIFILPVVASNEFPYMESFESGDAGWKSEEEILDSVTWELGIPVGAIIDGASDGDNAWVTNLSGSYISEEHSWINSPCFDFSTLTQPMLSFDLWSHVKEQRSGLVVEYSINGGDEWIMLGDDQGAKSINWYNTSAISGIPRSESLNAGALGWSGETNQWESVRHSLDILKGESSVRFRFAFGADSDDPEALGLEGFGIDNIFVGERSRVILLEHFTNVADADAADSDVEIDNLLAQHSGELISINYHTSFPGEDPFNVVNKADPSARRLYYGVSKPPTTVLGGTNIAKILSNANAIPFSDSIQIKTLEAPKFNIEVTLNAINHLLTIDTKVTAVSNQTFEADELVIHTAVIETAITQEGGIANNVLKKLLPDAAGHTIGKVFDKGAIEQFNVSWEGKHIYDSANLIIVVFIQNRVSKEIYQVAYLNAPITENIVITGIEDFGVESELIIYPQPASDEVILQFDSKLKHNYTWKIVDQRGITLRRGKFDRGNRLTKIETSQFPSGLYFMYVKGSNNEVVRKKFVIAH